MNRQQLQLRWRRDFLDVLDEQRAVLGNLK